MIGNYYNPSNYLKSGYGNTYSYGGNSLYNPSGSQYDTNQQAIHTAAINKLQNDYKQSVQSTVNNLNRRGLFGSSIASEDIGKTNYAMGQAEATLAGQEAKTEQANFLELQKLQTQQAQFQQQMAFQREQQKFQNMLAQAQLKQQKINANREAGRPDWW